MAPLGEKPMVMRTSLLELSMTARKSLPPAQLMPLIPVTVIGRPFWSEVWLPNGATLRKVTLIGWANALPASGRQTASASRTRRAKTGLLMVILLRGSRTRLAHCMRFGA
jgi:hypothetical protein